MDWMPLWCAFVSMRFFVARSITEDSRSKRMTPWAVAFRVGRSVVPLARRAGLLAPRGSSWGRRSPLEGPILRLVDGGPWRPDTPRAINLISGHSRTGDIEQTIVLGAHGPYRVHILLLDSDAAG